MAFKFSLIDTQLVPVKQFLSLTTKLSALSLFREMNVNSTDHGFNG
jgi:hypothetical protein